MLAPNDREQQAYRVAEEFAFLSFSYLADELDMRLRQERLNPLSEVLLIDTVNLGRDLQLHASQRSNPDRTRSGAFPRDSAKKEVPPARSSAGTDGG